MLLQQSSGGPASGSAAAATPPSTPTVGLHQSQSGVSPSARVPAAGGSHFDAITRLNHRMTGYRSHSSEQEVRYNSVCESLNNKSLHESAQLRQQLVSSSANNSVSKSKGSKSGGSGSGARAGNKRSAAGDSANGSGTGTGSAATTGRANKLPKLTPKSTPSATTPLLQQQQQQQLPPASSSPSSACSLPVEFKNNNYSNGSSHCNDSSSSNGLVSDVKPDRLASHPNTPSSRMSLPSTPTGPNGLMADVKRESNGSFDGVVSDELRDLKNVSYPGLEFDNNSLLDDLDSLSDTDHFQDVDYIKNILIQIQTTCATPVTANHFNLHNHHSHMMHHNNHMSSSSHLNHHSHSHSNNHNNSPLNPHSHMQSCPPPPGMSQTAMGSTPPPHHHINNNMMNGRVPTIPPGPQQQMHFNGSSGNQSFAVNGGSGDMHAGNGSISAAGNSILNPNIGMQSQQQMRPSPMRGTSPIRPPFGHPQQLQQQQQSQSNVPVQQQQRLQSRPPVHNAGPGMQSQQQAQQQQPPQQFNPRVPSLSPGMGADYPRPGMGHGNSGQPQSHMQMAGSSSPAASASVVYSSRVMPAGPVHLMTGPDGYAAGYPSNSAPPGYGQSNGGPDHWNQSQMQQQQQQQSHPVPPQNQAMRPQQQQMPQIPQTQQQHLQQAQFMQR